MALIVVLIFSGSIGIGTILATLILRPAVDLFQDRIVWKMICREYMRNVIIESKDVKNLR